MVTAAPSSLSPSARQGLVRVHHDTVQSHSGVETERNVLLATYPRRISPGNLCVCVLEHVDMNSQCLDISRFRPRLGLREYELENVGGSCDQKATRVEHLRETPCRNCLLQLSTQGVLYSFRAIFKNFTQRNAPPTFFSSNHFLRGP